MSIYPVAHSALKGYALRNQTTVARLERDCLECVVECGNLVKPRAEAAQEDPAILEQTVLTVTLLEVLHSALRCP